MIKAIETQYKGYRFRSRLEARWAVFLDTLGAQWEYENEGYDLGGAGWYLPDFWLPSLNIYLEIKPNYEALKGGVAKAAALCEKASVVILFDLPSEPGDTPQGIVWERSQVGAPYNYGFWWAYTDHALGLLNDNSGYYLWRGHDALFSVGGRNATTYRAFKPLCQHPRVLKAFSEATSARFEHGAQVQP